MDKKDIKIAINTILLKTAQESGLSANLNSQPGSGQGGTAQNYNSILDDPNAVIPVGSGQPVLKQNPVHSDVLATMTAFPDRNKIIQVIASTLSNLGFSKTKQYTPEESQQFISSIKVALNTLCGNYLKYINSEFFSG